MYSDGVDSKLYSYTKSFSGFVANLNQWGGTKIKRLVNYMWFSRDCYLSSVPYFSVHLQASWPTDHSINILVLFILFIYFAWFDKILWAQVYIMYLGGLPKNEISASSIHTNILQEVISRLLIRVWLMCALRLSIFRIIFSGIEKAVNTFSIPEKICSKNRNYYVLLRHTLAKSY